MAVLAVATALLVLLRQPTADEIHRGPLARLIDLGRRQWVPLGVGLATVAMGFADVIEQGQTAWLPTVIANIAMITLAVWLMHVGGATSGAPIPMGHGLAGRAAKSGRITFEDRTCHVRFRDGSHGLVLAIAIPLIVGARVVGALEARHVEAQVTTRDSI